VSRESFNKICEMLKDGALRDRDDSRAISLEKKVAIALYVLGSSAEYRTVGHIFGVSKSFVCTTLLNFSEDV